MRYKIKEIKPNIEWLSLRYGLEVIRYKEGSLLINGDKKADLQSITLGKNGFIQRKYTNNRCILSNSLLNFEKELDSNLSYSIGGIISENGSIFETNSRLDEKLIAFRKDYYYHNFKTDEKIPLIKNGIGYFTINYSNSSKSVFRSINKLIGYSLTTGNYEWEIDLGQYSTEKETVKIKEILGVWQENLVVLMDNNDILVLISLKTGQIAAEIRHILAQFPKEGPWGFGWHFHLEGDYIYLLQQNRYLQIDLATQQIETLWIPENTNFNIQRVSYDSEYAYFMACDGYHVYTDILGVFDRKALKIAWQHTEPIYSSHPPQSDGKKLYCLDNEGTLHIFERESEG